jgi:hypothetical protein
VSDDLVRASNAERERVVGELREHFVEGRLTLEQFVERLDAVYAATTLGGLEVPLSDLPAPVGAPRRGVTRFLLALLGSSEREGRLRIRRRVLAFACFGNIDLDLRQASFEGERTTIVLLGAFAALDVYVPEGVEVDLQGLVIFGHRNANGNDPVPRPGTPLVRVVALGLFAGIDVWRVPTAWARWTIGQVIEGIERGRHRALEDGRDGTA